MSVSILVVDDEPDVAELFRQRFRREARQGTYVLHFAASGEEALQMLAHEIEPQLIVMLSDINMPGMDGLPCCARSRSAQPDLPVMMVTAYGDDERRRRASEFGAAEFITKPVDFDRLKRQLQQLPRPAGVTGEPAKILAVDDEADFELLIRQRFRRQIRRNEFAFRFARHGEEALDVLAEEADIELLLLDINMPVMDGLTLLAELRQRQSPVRAIIVSAYGDMTNIRTAMNRGAFDFVTKPVDFERSRNHDPQDARRDRTGCAKSIAGAPRPSARAANLSRYFSPNIVEMLAERDEPLGAVRRQTVAVMFADIVGFTTMAEGMAARSGGHHAAGVSRADDGADLRLRRHRREIYRRRDLRRFWRAGTAAQTTPPTLSLRRYDAGRARRSGTRSARPAGRNALAIGIGLNYGPAVLGDVGSEHSLSFTVIGDTVNTASRLQALTRSLETPLVVSDPLVRAVKEEPSETAAALVEELRDWGDQALRGREGTVRIWTRKPTLLGN